MTAFLLRRMLATAVWGALAEGYLVVTEPQTWDGAQQFCEWLGSHLVTIDSTERQADVLSVVKAQYPNVGSYWIGLRKVEGQFLWVADNSSLSTYSSWNEGDPHTQPSGDGDCVHAAGSLDFNWNDLPCSTHYPFVCDHVDNGIVRGDGYMLLARNKNATEGIFSLQVITTGVENVAAPDANTYSIIGAVDPASFLIDDTRYELELVYTYDDGTSDVLRWSQESWITETTIVNADLSEISDYHNGPSSFHGLAKSHSSTQTYLDGSDGDSIYWFHAVASVHLWNGGIPGHEGKAAYRSELWARRVQTSATTESTLNDGQPMDTPSPPDEETCGCSPELGALRNDIVGSVTEAVVSQLAEIVNAAILSSQDTVIQKVAQDTESIINSRFDELQT